MQKITSKANPLISLVKKLTSDRKYRYQTNLFVAESLRVIKTLLLKFTCQNLIVCSNNKNRQLLSKLNQYNLNIVYIDEQTYSYISDLSNGDGFIGVFKIQHLDFNIKPNKKYLILNKLQNQINVGLIIRSACAFDIDGIFITNQSVDIFHPDVLRSCMGNLANINIKCSTSLIDTINHLKNHGYTIYATAINIKSQEIHTTEFAKSSAIVIGNEGNGLTNSELHLCDKIISISTNKNVDSLNVATATGIICYYLKNTYNL